MHDAIILTGGFLMIGGAVVTMVGMIWEKTANLLRVFGVNAKSGAAIWVLLGGLAAMAAGYGVLTLGFYLEKR